MTADINLLRQFTSLLKQSDPVAVRAFLAAHPDVAARRDVLIHRLHDAAGRDDVPMMELLTEFGADVNAPILAHDPPEGAVKRAASQGALKAVTWLIDHGANLNVEVEGVRRCFPLADAIIGGHLDVVKLLVQRGADVNAAWAGKNALSFARIYRNADIERYLLSVGARQSSESPPSGLPEYVEELRAHVEKYIGPLSPLSLKEVVAGNPPVTIDVVKLVDRIVLLTRGMSSCAMNVPPGEEAFAHAELYISLPPDWPLDSLDDPRYAWPVKWLRQIAFYPHVNQTWLGGPAVIIANGEPPKALAPNTGLSCLLLFGAANAFSRTTLRDGTRIQFYAIWPLYAEERDFERTEGMPRLLDLLRQNNVSAIVDIHRPNTAAR